MRGRTFVLVHGAWHGGWCWRRTADLLQSRGHRVFTPTLTGLGERSHLLGPAVDLQTHVADITNLIKWERLDDIVLVGHSYAGFVVTGVAETTATAISSIVFLDAFFPQDGDAMVDVTNAQVADGIRAAVQNGAPALPPRSAAAFHVNEKDRAWIDAMCTPHPIATMIEPLRVTGARDRIARRTYIRATDYPNPAFDLAYARLGREPGWQTLAAPCGHDVMVDMPEWLADTLEQVA
jgi:pimeloyl-ACP methyl ester carboxylesterase